MRHILFSLLLLVTLGCGQTSQTPFSGAFMGSQLPLIALKPVEDRAQSGASAKAASALGDAVKARLVEKGHLALTSRNEQFVVNMKLVQHEQILQTPPELSMSVQLEILDMRASPTQVILQEVISINTLLEKPLIDTRLISLEDESFRISPLGLAHAKLSREVAARIEDYIALARKG